MFTNKYSISILNLCEHVSCINMSVIYKHIWNLHNFHITCKYGASIQNMKTIYDLMNNIRIHTSMQKQVAHPSNWKLCFYGSFHGFPQDKSQGGPRTDRYKWRAKKLL